MISQTAEYALRATVFLAEVGRPQTTLQIAAATQVPAGYLAKVMQSLAKADIVRSQRGLGGGFSLGAEASELTVYDVVQAVDPVVRIHRCPLDNPAHANRLCALHRSLDEAAERIEETFRSCTLADMTGEPTFS